MKTFTTDFIRSTDRYAARLTFPDGTDYPGEILKLTLTSSLNGSTSQLQLGSAPAAMLTGTLEAVGLPLENRTLTLRMGRLVGGIPEEAVMGRFTITSAAAQGGVVEITGYDSMAVVMELPYVSTGSPATATAVLGDICSQAGLPLALSGGLTDAAVENIAAGYTRREMAAYMAMLLGGNACIDPAGALTVKWYHDTDLSFTPDEIYSGGDTLSQEELELSRMDCSTTVPLLEEDEDGTTTMSEVTELYSAGDGAPCLSLSNPWMNQELLYRLWNQMGGLRWHSGSISMVGDLRVEAGDIVTVFNTQGTAYTFPVMEVTHEYDGGLKTTITAYGKSTADSGLNTSGALNQSVERMSARLAMFEQLTADNFSAAKATINNLSANKADLNLANIEEGCITNAMIESVSADKLTAGTIDAQEISVINLNADNLTVGTINGARIEEGAISEDKLAENAVTTNKIARNTITAEKIDVTDLFAQDIHATGSISGLTLKSTDLSFYTDSAEDELAGHIYFNNGLHIESAAGTMLSLDASRGIDMGMGRVYTQNLSVKDVNVPVIITGCTASVSVPANSYVDQQVSFNHTFDEAPTVFATLKTASTGTKMGLVQVGVYGISKTGCVLRVYNSHTSAFSPYIQWMAVG